LKFEIEEKPITKMKELKEKHPSIKVYVGVMPRRAVFNGTNEYTESSQDGCYYEDVQKYTRDVQRIRESLKKHLTAELGGQVAVMSEYYKIMRELELEEE
jgi:predicted phosphohydrolase